MGRPTRIGTATILEAAEAALRKGGAAGLTLDRVAEGAGCAKGLVHYHFRSRGNLLVAVNARLWQTRERRWTESLRGNSAADCVRASWALLVAEAKEGVTRAWTTLLAERDTAIIESVRQRLQRFDSTVGRAATQLLQRAGLETTIPSDEVGRVLAAGIHGLGLQVAAHGRSQGLEDAYSALWLGMLSLTRPLG